MLSLFLCPLDINVIKNQINSLLFVKKVCETRIQRLKSGKVKKTKKTHQGGGACAAASSQKALLDYKTSHYQPECLSFNNCIRFSAHQTDFCLSCVGGGRLKAGSKLWQAVRDPSGPHPRAQHSAAVFHG